MAFQTVTAKLSPSGRRYSLTNAAASFIGAHGAVTADVYGPFVADVMALAMSTKNNRGGIIYGSAQFTGGDATVRAVQGTVVEGGLTPLNYAVRAYRSDNGALLGQARAVGGRFLIRWQGYQGQVDVVAYDDAGGVAYNAIIKSNVVTST